MRVPWPAAKITTLNAGWGGKVMGELGLRDEGKTPQFKASGATVDSIVHARHDHIHGAPDQQGAQH
jgi:hypothetical protein